MLASSGSLAVPEEYKCPISGQLMEDPVLTEDGFTYDRQSLLNHLTTNTKSPITGLELGLHPALVPHLTRQKQIKWWKALHCTTQESSKEVALTLRRIGEQVRMCRENQRNGANELTYLEEEKTLIFDNLQKLRRNQAKLEARRDAGADVADKLNNVQEHKESLLRRLAVVDERVQLLSGGASAAKKQLAYGREVLASMTMRAKKSTMKKDKKKKEDVEVKKDEETEKENEEVGVQATPVEVVKSEEASSEPAPLSKKEQKEEQKAIKEMMAIVDTLEKEVEPLVQQERSIEHQAHTLRTARHQDKSLRPGAEEIHKALLAMNTQACSDAPVSSASVEEPAEPSPDEVLLDLEALTETQVSGEEELKQQVFGTGQVSATMMQAHKDEVNVMCTLPNGTLASGADDACIFLWNPAKPTAKPGKIKAMGKSIWSLQVVMRKGKLCLASGTWDGSIHLWDIKSGKHQASLQGHTDAAFRLAVLPDGVLVSASWDTTVRLWDPDTASCLGTLVAHTGKVRALGVLPDGRFASAGDDLVITVWEGDSSKGQMQCVRQLSGHTKPIECLAVLLDGHLASASQDKKLMIWDVDKGTCVRVLEGHTATIRTMQTLSDGFLASGGMDKSIKVWHVNTGTLVHTIENAHDKDVVCMALLPFGQLISGGWDKALKLWNWPVRRG